jgi:hypothetical protein
VSALDWAVRYAVPLLSAVGVLLYGVLRLAYVFFYLQLRVTPQEVGYGYVEILSSQLIGTVELVLLLTATLLLGTLTAYGVVRGTRRALASPNWTRWVRRAQAARNATALAKAEPIGPLVARLALRCGVAAMLIVPAVLPAMAWLHGTDARNGYTVRNVYLDHTVRIPILAVQAVPAAVAWTTTAPPGLLDLKSRRCLLYLGQAAGTTVFYDVTTRESLRVPTAQIIVSVQNSESVPVGC